MFLENQGAHEFAQNSVNRADPREKSVRCNRALVETELVVGGTLCYLSLLFLQAVYRMGRLCFHRHLSVHGGMWSEGWVSVDSSPIFQRGVSHFL